MKTNILSVLCLSVALLFTGISFTSCLKGDDVDTNQYSGGISLNVFGPSPVARGGELRFIGSGMSKVTAVAIQGCEDITEINKVSDAEIRVTVPQEAQPGLVVLRTPKGDITTKTELTFTEPISIESFSPMSVRSGDELTISGEYLNLIHEVIFADEVVVPEENFLSHDRKTIKVVVPEEARTGQVALSDGAEMPNVIYSDEDLTVTLPSVDEVDNLVEMKPNAGITITGENLDLVKTVIVPGNPENVEVEFSVEAEQLKFELPENAADGNIEVVPASGVHVTVGVLSMAVPEITGINPVSDIKVGDEITVSGTNLDVVSTLSFAGMEETVLPTSQSDTELKVLMPDMGQSGDLILNTKSGKQKVAGRIETLKPQFTDYDNSNIPAGQTLQISGTNLNLVASVTFGGDKTVEVIPSSDTHISVMVPMDAESGNVILNMKNGEKVECSLLTVSKPECCYVITMPDKVEAGELLELEVANGSFLQSVSLNGASLQFILRDNKLLVSLPADATEEVEMKLTSSNGVISYTMNIVGSMGTLIYQGPTDTGAWDDSAQIESGLFETAQVGQVITVVVSDLGINAQGSFKNSNWGAIASGTEYFDISGNFTLTITQDILSQLQSGGLIVSGQNYTIESVYIK